MATWSKVTSMAGLNQYPDGAPLSNDWRYGITFTRVKLSGCFSLTVTEAFFLSQQTLNPVNQYNTGNSFKWRPGEYWETYFSTSLFQFSLTKSQANKCPGKWRPTVLMMNDSFCVRMVSPLRLFFINLKSKADLVSKVSICHEVITELNISASLLIKVLKQFTGCKFWVALRLINRLKTCHFSKWRENSPVR